MVKKLVRKGNCKNCGRCCVGCDYYSEVLIKEKGSHCAIYAERSTACREEPSHFCFIPDDECGFRFYDAETGERLYHKLKAWPDRSWTDDEFVDLFLYGYEPVGGVRRG